MSNKDLKRVTGLGGFFFKSEDPKAIRDWYATHLGIPVNDYGWTFRWKDQDGNDAATQWSPFEANTKYFAPSEKPFMINYRVHDLEALLAALKEEGVTIVGEMESHSYGKFGWILDPEGNKIELWEPTDVNAL
ncbi:VOC family protein [Flavobacterium sp.]|uniref:VOC family protein n=1 Tax=Flavobacterium sp. TaxID=239 RepID=UPI002FDA7F6B